MSKEQNRTTGERLADGFKTTAWLALSGYICFNSLSPNSQENVKDLAGLGAKAAATALSGEDKPQPALAPEAFFVCRDHSVIAQVNETTSRVIINPGLTAKNELVYSDIHAEGKLTTMSAPLRWYSIELGQQVESKDVTCQAETIEGARTVELSSGLGVVLTVTSFRDARNCPEGTVIPEWYIQGGVGYGDETKTGMAEKATIGMGSLVAKYHSTCA